MYFWVKENISVGNNSRYNRIHWEFDQIVIDGPWCCWLILFFHTHAALVTSAKSHFRGGESYCILMKDYENKRAFVCLFCCRITCTDEECTIRPGTFMKKARVNFDSTSGLIIHSLIYPCWLAAHWTVGRREDLAGSFFYSTHLPGPVLHFSAEVLLYSYVSAQC